MTHGVHVAEAAMGAVAEAVKQSGGNLHYHAHGAGQIGQYAVQGIVAAAPVVAAKFGVVAAAAHVGAVAAVAAAGPVVLVSAGAAAVGYGVYRVWKLVRGA